jgi:hypothetical protein
MRQNLIYEVIYLSEIPYSIINLHNLMKEVTHTPPDDIGHMPSCKILIIAAHH